MILSQRNLLTLLFGLTEKDEDTLFKPGGVPVTAQSDEKHYQGRRYGRMSCNCERFIKDVEEWLAARAEDAKRQRYAKAYGCNGGCGCMPQLPINVNTDEKREIV